MEIVIIVEGKNDRTRLRNLLSHEVEIICTNGTPGTDQIEKIKKTVGNRQVLLFTDNDSSGKRIRGIMCDVFSDAQQIYTRKGYAGVEGTPDEYLILQLEKAGLQEYFVTELS